jgi:hypothetical protein
VIIDSIITAGIIKSQKLREAIKKNFSKDVHELLLNNLKT